MDVCSCVIIFNKYSEVIFFEIVIRWYGLFVILTEIFRLSGEGSGVVYFLQNCVEDL